MSDDTDRIKERIRKLLQLAGDDAAMGNEIENALRFARRLTLRAAWPHAEWRPQETRCRRGTGAGRPTPRRTAGGVCIY